jgi:hypothetical protein
MNILNIGDIIKGVGSIADDLFTSDEERLKVALQEKNIEASLIQGQLAVNAKEAEHASVFVAGWRPFIGWIGGLALAYQFILYPLLIWIWSLGQAQGWIPCHINSEAISQVCTFTTPPVLDSGALFAMLTGLLGIGGMRSFDKFMKTDTKKID